eukprot:Gb_34988 [translate_table: standard]
MEDAENIAIQTGDLILILIQVIWYGDSGSDEQLKYQLPTLNHRNSPCKDIFTFRIYRFKIMLLINLPNFVGNKSKISQLSVNENFLCNNLKFSRNILLGILL